MTCYHPITCIWPIFKDDEGKRRLLFSLPSETESFSTWKTDNKVLVYDSVNNGQVHGFKIQVPCGKCIGCRLDYSRMWAMRSVHEAKMHKENCFVTLTFNDDHLPDDGSLNSGYIQSWLKRFRYKYGDGIRYMLCGEYGMKRQRPHYHILFYGFNFPDRYVWSCRRGNIYYRSPGLEELWRDACSSESNGFSVIGDVNFESSAYVARYVTKKVLGASAKKHYGDREKEFLRVSRMPGLGNEYFQKYWRDMFNIGYVLMENKGNIFKAPIPRYYKNLFKIHHPDLYNCYKLDSEKEMIHNLFKENLDLTRQRLDVQEELQKLKLDKLVRIYEMDSFLHNI